MRRLALRRAALLALGLPLLGLPTGATWSIVAVDPATGEVAIASATCLLNTRLQELTPALLVGRGAGTSQALVDFTAVNRILMVSGFQRGWSAEQILEDISVNGAGALPTRTFGIVSMVGAPLSFTGAQAAQATVAFGVTGTIGSVRYAIQGGALTGTGVIYETERVFRATPGDLSQRLLAAMETARALGGDGRCSCSGANPTGCGSPPPSFAKSSHTAFVYVARIGDEDGPCGPPLGCATGDYYLKLARKSRWSGTDPVLLVADAYERWRDSWRGRPDHLRSQVEASAGAAPADGLTSVDYLVRLADVDGAPLTAGGATLTVTSEVGGLTRLSPVSDHGDGTYGFRATVGLRVGREVLRIVADDGRGPVTLYPFRELALDPVEQLHVGRAVVSVTAGGSVPFVLQDPALVDEPFVLLATSSGTTPGQAYGALHVPLNADAVFAASLAGAGGPLLPGSLGALGDTGRTELAFRVPPGLLAAWVEERLEWAAVFFGPAATTSNVVGFDLIP